MQQFISVSIYFPPYVFRIDQIGCVFFLISKQISRIQGRKTEDIVSISCRLLSSLLKIKVLSKQSQREQYCIALHLHTTRIGRFIKKHNRVDVLLVCHAFELRIYLPLHESARSLVRSFARSRLQAHKSKQANMHTPSDTHTHSTKSTHCKQIAIYISFTLSLSLTMNFVLRFSR